MIFDRVVLVCVVCILLSLIFDFVDKIPSLILQSVKIKLESLLQRVLTLVLTENGQSGFKNYCVCFGSCLLLLYISLVSMMIKMMIKKHTVIISICQILKDLKSKYFILCMNICLTLKENLSLTNKEWVVPLAFIAKLVSHEKLTMTHQNLKKVKIWCNQRRKIMKQSWIDRLHVNFFTNRDEGRLILVSRAF